MLVSRIRTPHRICILQVTKEQVMSRIKSIFGHVNICLQCVTSVSEFLSVDVVNFS